MRLDFVPYPLLTGLGLLVLNLIQLRRHQRKLAYLFCFSLFWLYLLLVVKLIVFPIPLPDPAWGRDSVSHILSRVNLAPFAFGGLFDLAPGVIFENLVGNVLLTIPFGFGIRFLVRVPAQRIPWLALGVGISLEAAQLIVSILIGGAYRGVDINDVLLNVVGVLVGYGIFRVLAWVSFRTYGIAYWK